MIYEKRHEKLPPRFHVSTPGEILDTLMEAKVLIKGWRQEDNRFRPHSSLGYRPPAPETKWLEKPIRRQYMDRERVIFSRLEKGQEFAARVSSVCLY